MLVKILVLFFAPFLSGLAVTIVPPIVSRNFRLLLIFAGSYLFSLTIIHILPELFIQNTSIAWVGIFVLAGFFLQQILEYLTSGIEHGHIHHHSDHEHAHKHIPSYVLLIALCVHAFLEGGMLADSDAGPAYDLNAILAGIALHRAPAAFALMTVLTSQLGSFRKGLPHLIIFALAAPAGLLVSTILNEVNIINSTGMIYLYALVSGNFLHISTTIVVEASPNHEFSSRNLISALIGALMAIAVGFII